MTDIRAELAPTSLPAFGARRTLPHALDAIGRHAPTATVLEENEQSHTARALLDEVRAAAAALLARGIGRGDAVAVWAPNGLRWIVAALAAQWAGAALVPLNTRFRGREAGDILRRARVRLLFIEPEFLGVDYLALIEGETLPHLEAIVPLTSATPNGDRPDVGRPHIDWEVFLASGRSVAASEVDRALGALAEDDISDIMFTSGTTGAPKGVMSSHGQTVSTIWSWIEATGLRPGDRYLIVNPFFHTFGYKAGWLACLLAGAVILPEQVFDPDRIVDRIESERISVLPGPPTLFQTILAKDAHKGRDLSALRLCVTGAASIPPTLIARMKEDLGFDIVISGYGLTESNGVVTMCREGDPISRVAGRCGRAIPGVEVKCIDDAGRDCMTEQAGEVVVRGFNVMKGYFDDPEATAAAIDDDGWLHTGDIGVLDEDGYLRITDRKKDLFICGGFNCYPAEIERILCEHPGVAAAAVIGTPDPRLGEVAKAFVVLRQGHSADEAEIIAWSRNAMANYKAPRRVVFLDALPVNAGGKVVKGSLR
jgi:HIP---CoA ligase